MNKLAFNKSVKTKFIVCAILLALLTLSFFFSGQLELAFGMNQTYAKNETSHQNVSNSNFRVYYLDVGQGNCIVIFLPDGKIAVVDGGDIAYGEKIYKFLNEHGVSTIDYLIASHSDSDHIGGLNYIFDKVEIVNIYRPFQIAGTGSNAQTFMPHDYEDLKNVYNHYAGLSSQNKISRVTSSTYANFIKNVYTETYSVENETFLSNVTVSYDGLKIIGSNYEFEFFAPLVRTDSVDLSTMSRTYGFATKGYGVTNTNDNSSVILFSCGSESFLFTGDCSWKNQETPSGSEIDFVNSLNSSEKAKLSDVSVYLAGHHGSDSSSSSELLELINPKFVVFSVGVNNFGHPSSSTIFRIEKTKNLQTDYMLRTDKTGTICFGNVNGETVYSLQNSLNKSNHSLSWELFSVIIYCVVVVLIFAKKPSTKSKLLTQKPNKSIIKIGD